MRTLLLLCSLFAASVAFAQSRTITGKVTNNKGEPVPFATVTVKGTTNSVAATETGLFTIKAATGQTLVVSATNYTSQEMIIDAGNEVTIILPLQETSLNEVVVTAAGIRRAEKALGYALSKVDPNSIVQKSEPDMLKSLQGKVAGVDVRSSQGTPGAATRIQLRGNSSFYGDNQPLIVVDGIPYSNNQVTTSNQTVGGGAYSSGINNLDPNDIASMNVLKGSTAAALYGSRASNGVIIITTKSGSAARNRKGLELSYRSSYSIENISNLPSYQNSYGAGTQFTYSNGSNGSWGPAFNTRPGGGVNYNADKTITPNGSNVDSIFTWPDYLAAYPEMFGPYVPYIAYPNNVKDLFQTGTVFENSISMNGGDEKTSVALTASQLNHTGYVPNSSYNRSNLSLGGASKLNIGLNIRGNFSYSKSHQLGGFFGENQVTDAASQFARSLFLARNWDMNLPYEDKEGNNLIPNGGGQYDHPKWSAKYNRVISDEERYVAGMHVDFNIKSWLRVDYSLGTNIATLNRKEITEIGSRSAEGKGRIVEDAYRNAEVESNFIITVTPNINNDFSLRILGGHNLNQRTNNRTTNTGNRIITRGIYTLTNTSQQTFGTDYYERRRLVGIFGEAVVGYKNYAFVDITGRNDWSSTLPVENRSYFYPSITGSFIFTDAFKLQSNVLTYGKLRGGWSKVGRAADPYYLQDVYVIGLGSLGIPLVPGSFMGQPGASVSLQKNNENLKPEFTQEVELGTQLSFFKGRIDLEFTWYSKKSTNLIAPILTPPSSGYSQFYTNYGEISNKGIEIDLNVVPVKTKDFRWEVHGAFTRNRNIVTKLVEGVKRLPLYGFTDVLSPYLEPGLPFGYLRGTVVQRDSLGNALINPQTGGMMIANEQGYCGNPNPDFKLGITNTFTYKGFTLSALFDMTVGGDINSETVSSLLGRGVTLDTKDREKVWIIPGVYGDPNTGKPILSGGKEIPNHTFITTNDVYFSPDATNGATIAFNTASEFNTFDATVYRLREVTLAYDFPKTMFKKLPIGSLTLSITGRNLWYLAPNLPRYVNFDPEVNSFGSTTTQGIEVSGAPTTRRFGINLNVTF